MGNPHWGGLENLVLVAGHAVYVADNFNDPASDNSWFLRVFQRGEPPFYIEHIRNGVDFAADDPKALLVFSGGQTRYEAGPKSEAQSYWMVADHFNWWWRADVRLRATTEEFARDSFENLLFSICRFYECCATYPQKVTVVSWGFKKERFELHRKAIHFPKSRFIFKGVNNPVDLDSAMQGESDAVKLLRHDPYGVKEDKDYLGDKKRRQNPFNRQQPYLVSCSQLAGLLLHRGPDYFDGELPWPKE